MAMAKERNRPFNELVPYFAIERFLFRLSKSPAGRQFVLKRALLLTAHADLPFRPTRDIDLMGRPATLETTFASYSRPRAFNAFRTTAPVSMPKGQT